MRRPRALVLDEVWRGLDGVEALSGPHGGPLRRTVKLILDPLVIRPMQHPACAGAVLTDDGATLLAGRVHAAADLLRATAAWFTLLKQVRRALRITEGNAQDLYFQRCYELATIRGHPDPARDRLRAEATLREIHEFAAGRTTQALKEHVTDPATAARLSGLIERAWGRRPGPVTAPDHGPLLRDLLDAVAAARTGTGRYGRNDPEDRHAHPGEPVSAADLFDAAVAGNVGTHTGITLWYRAFDVDADDTAAPVDAVSGDTAIPPRTGSDGYPESVDRSTGTSHHPVGTSHQSVGAAHQSVGTSKQSLMNAEQSVGTFIRSEGTSSPSAGVSGRELGLTAHPLPPRPEVGSSAATATLGPPLDRTIHERVFTVLQASTERSELPLIPDLVTDEIARSCAPWALLDESLRATAAVGAALATGLAPLDRPRLTAVSSDGPAENGAGESAAHRTVNARWRREAYVLQARRLAVHTVASTPHDRDPLTLIAAELRSPWRAYLRRLWVRLHGRDVRGLPMDTPHELWDLLDGVARSVILDHRTRVKKALSANTLAPVDNTSESRAS